MEENNYHQFIVKWSREVSEKIESLLIIKDERSKKIDELIKETSVARKELYLEIRDKILKGICSKKIDYDERIKEIEEEYKFNALVTYKRCSNNINLDVKSIIWHLDKIKESLIEYAKIYTISEEKKL